MTQIVHPQTSQQPYILPGVPPSPIPAPLPPWARALLQLAPLISPYLQELLEHIGVLPDATQAGSSWRRFVGVWHDPSNPDPADFMMTTLDVANITGGALDDTWTDADYTTAATQVNGLFNGWTQSQMRQPYAFKESRAYRMAFNPLSDPKPFAISGPPERVFPGGTIATLGGAMPTQVALTHTEITAYPRHWGRSYWPAPVATNVQADGTAAVATCDSWATAVEGVFAALMAAEFFPVVPVTQVLKQPTRGLLTVSAVQVDNIYDITRRRRKHTTSYRKVLPVAP